VKRYLPFIIVALVAVLTLGAGTMLYRAKRPVVLTIPRDQIAKDGDESIHVRGNPKAPVTLEEFGDFECPPCGHLAGAIKELEHEFGDRLRVIFHHFPLTNHAHAREAAYAAEAAGLQGHFWEMHDLLYKEQGVWSKVGEVRPLFNAYAGILGLNTERFARDMENEEVKMRVAGDAKRGEELGITNTPTVFINNTAVPFASLNPAGLRTAVNDAGAKPKTKP
jgi:protein-disulfide isomerase